MVLGTWSIGEFGLVLLHLLNHGSFLVICWSRSYAEYGGLLSSFPCLDLFKLIVIPPTHRVLVLGTELDIAGPSIETNQRTYQWSKSFK